MVVLRYNIVCVVQYSCMGGEPLTLYLYLCAQPSPAGGRLWTGRAGRPTGRPHSHRTRAAQAPAGGPAACTAVKRASEGVKTTVLRRCASWHTAVHTSFSKRSRKNPVLQKPKPFAFSYADGLELQLARAALCAPGPMVAQRAAARTSRHEGPEAIHIRPIRAYGTSHAAPRASACAILFTIALLLRVVGNRCVSPTSSARTSGKHVSGPCSEVRRSALTALIVIPPSASHACTLSRPSARLPSAPR